VLLRAVIKIGYYHLLYIGLDAAAQTKLRLYTVYSTGLLLSLSTVLQFHW